MKSPKKNNRNLSEGPIGPLLRKLTLQMLLGVSGMVVFNLIDTVYIGQLGTAELAALSYTFPVIMVITSLGFGMGIGASSVISRAVGEGNQEKVQRLTTDSLVLSVLLVLIFVVAGMLSIEPLFKLLGASDEIIPLIKDYMQIWYIGVLFVIVPMVGNNALRANGDMKTPAIVMLVIVIVNIILDPILIFGFGSIPAMGLRGAAIATVIARSVSLVVGLYFLQFKYRMLSTKIPTFEEGFRSWREIAFIALPAALSKMIAPLSLGIITSIVSTFGKEAVAAYGAASKLEFMVIAVVISLSSVLNPFVGQNIGAGRLDRVNEGLRKSKIFTMFWGFGAWALLLALGQFIAPAFSDNKEVIEYITLFLSIVPIGYILKGVFDIGVNALNVLKKPLHATLLSIVQMLVLYVPLAYLGAHLFGLWGVFAALAISNLMAGAISHFLLKRVLLELED